MINDIETIFESLVTDINTEFSISLHSQVGTGFNLDLVDILESKNTANKLSLIYSGTDYDLTYNSGQKDSRTHNYIVVIGHKQSVDIALWLIDNFDEYNKVGDNMYLITVEYLTPMSATNEAFLKTAIGLKINEK